MPGALVTNLVGSPRQWGMEPFTPVGTEVGRYRLESVIGRGGMAIVYQAEDLRLGRRVALKVLAPELAESPDFRERFLRESRFAAGLEHPNIVPIYEAGDADGLLYISLIHISEPTRLLSISYAVFCLKKKKKTHTNTKAQISTTNIQNIQNREKSSE